MFLIGALITSQWVPEVLRYSLGGLSLGAVLGLIGFALTRWESSRGVVHFTPNRWLVLTVTIFVAGRIFYGVWRVWAAWQTGIERIATVTASGIAMSIAAGAVVLGYYLVYWISVSRRLRYSRTRVIGRNLPDIDRHPMFTQRLRPRFRLRRVAADQRPVDNRTRNPRHDTTSSGKSARRNALHRWYRTG